MTPAFADRVRRVALALHPNKIDEKFVVIFGVIAMVITLSSNSRHSLSFKKNKQARY